jgi:broad specificity phosphatase PhoE
MLEKNMKNTIPLIPFIFIRHGQTDWNLKDMWQGWTDIPLNETGHAQAHNATSFLSNKGISRIISSPLLRAHKTAEIINNHLKIPLSIVGGLKERSYGVLEGTTIDWIHTDPIEKSEPVDEFKIRIANTLHEILDPEHTTLIVAHGGVYWAITEIIGFKEQHSDNCIPYLFIPPKSDQLPWTIDKLAI